MVFRHTGFFLTACCLLLAVIFLNPTGAAPSIQGKTPDRTLPRQPSWPAGKCPCIDPRLENREWPPPNVKRPAPTEAKTETQPTQRSLLDEIKEEKKEEASRFLGAGVGGLVALLVALGAGAATSMGRKPYKNAAYTLGATSFFEEPSVMDLEPEEGDTSHNRPTFVQFEDIEPAFALK